MSRSHWHFCDIGLSFLGHQRTKFYTIVSGSGRSFWFSPNSVQLRQIHFNFANMVSIWILRLRNSIQLREIHFNFANMVSTWIHPPQPCYIHFNFAKSFLTSWIQHQHHDQFRQNDSNFTIVPSVEWLPYYLPPILWFKFRSHPPMQQAMLEAVPIALEPYYGFCHHKLFPKLINWSVILHSLAKLCLIFSTSRQHVSCPATHTHCISRTRAGCHNCNANSAWRCCAP